MLKLIDFLICTSCASEDKEKVFEVAISNIALQADHMALTGHRDWDLLDIPPSLRNAQRTAGILKDCLKAWIEYIGDTTESRGEIKFKMFGAMSEALKLAEESH